MMRFGQGRATHALTAIACSLAAMLALAAPALAVAPSAPQAVTASPATAQALVSWGAPASDGGSAITSYTVTPYIGSAAQTPVTVTGAPPATSSVVTGLSNGTAYTFTVTATNADGTSPASAPAGPITPRDTIFDFSGTPAKLDAGDLSAGTLGVKFTSDVSGSVTGIRFYKGVTANNGTHVGSMWDATGNLLEQATFTGETPTGWQTVDFPSSVPVSPGATYIAAYYDPNGHYAATSFGLSNGADNAPLHAVADSTSPDGVFTNGPVSAFPTSSFQANNYWVDVLFLPSSLAVAPATPTNVVATSSDSGADLMWTAPADGGSQITSYTITPYIGSTPQPATTINGTPAAATAHVTGLTNGQTYTFTVTATNAKGSSAASAASNAVTPTAAFPPSAPTAVTASPASSQALVSWTAPSSNGGAPINGYTITPYIGSTAQTPRTASAGATSATVTGLQNGQAYTFTVKASNSAGASPESTATAPVTPEDTIFDFNGTPSNLAVNDPSPGELGVKFTADGDGTISGIRFYKGSVANSGTHVGSLWDSGGNLLAQATFTNETATGWQAVTFASPVVITAGTTYVAGYFDPQGNYAATSFGLTNAIDHPPLHAVGNGTSPNGVFAYGTSPTFPTSSFQANNYWVDVLFQPASAAPGTVTGVSATAGAGAATISWSAPSTGGIVTKYIVTPYIGSAAQTPVTVSGSVTSTTINGLTGGTTYTFTVQASNSVGAGPASASSNAVTPTTASPPSAPTGVSAGPASSEALVSWTTPASDGGSPITGYTITPYVGSTAQTPTAASASATSATVTGLQNGQTYTFKVTATNNAGTSPASAASPAVTPEDTIFDFGSTPQKIDAGDASANELGVKFTADADGTVTGIRFYKAAANTGTHVGSLWDTSGNLLAQATFSGETASGWQTVTFAQPVTIFAGTTYVAGYYDPNGHYSATSNGLSTAVDNPPLHAVANGTSPDGVYAYASSPTFPTSTYQANNYWVDVLFAPATSVPAQVTGVSATAGAGTATVSWAAPSNGSVVGKYIVTPYLGATAQPSTTVPASQTSVTISGLTAGSSYTFTVQAANTVGAGPASSPSNAVTPTAATAPGAPTGVSASPATGQALVRWSPPASDGGTPIASYTITPYIGSAAQAPTTVTGSPPSTAATVTGLTNGTAYTFTVKATNSAGTGAQSTASSAVTPQYTLFDFSGAPQQVDAGDASSGELGVKFTADNDGTIAGIRFYKSAANGGTHIGSLWSATGQLLAQATFTGESSSGWQYALFSSPVTITAGTTYVAGYFDPQGHYSATPEALANQFDNGPLHAVGNASSVNGVYAYSGTSAFPTASYHATNYWVDVLYTPVTAAGQVTNVQATAGQQSANLTWSAPTTGGAVTKYTITPYIGSSAQTPTVVSGTTTSTTVIGLLPDETYTFTVQAVNSAGAGPVSAQSNAVTPTAATAPSAPWGVTATPATGQVLVSWSPPASNGGSPVSSYTITPYIGSTAQPATQVSSGSATSAVVTGLTNGQPYKFSVKATNTIGTSPESGASSVVTPEFTILDFSGTPTELDSGDQGSGELGVKFTADAPGTIIGIRFYKGTTNNGGTHIGSLWDASGNLLAQATFTGETATGWQTVTFASPVAIAANTTYVAGYFDPQGHYTSSPGGMAAGFDNPPLHALAGNVTANSVYAYSSSPTFPTSTYNSGDYWVDVLYSPSSTNQVPAAPTSVTATAGFAGATVSWSAPWNGGSAITGYTITPYVGGVAQAATTITGSPPAITAAITGLTNGTAYTFKVAATNANGTGPQSAASAAVTPGPQPAGQWSPLTNWPLVAVHSVLMKTGKVLTWDAWQQPAPTQEFDPATQTFTNPINSPDGLFCSAMAQMPDGRILVIGGYGELSTGNLGIVDTNIYDPTTSTWTRVADMHSPRWYAGLTELPDGRYVTVSGKSSDFNTWVDTPEVYDPSANTWTQLTGVSTSQIHELEYPNTYLLPNGNVFVLGPQEDLSYELGVGGQTWTQVGGKSGVVNGGSVMYRPGKVLYAGGAASLASASTAQANAATIDLTGSNPQWQPAASMAYPRAFNTMQMLADGTVLAVGGEPTTGQPNGQGEVSGGVLPAEIWDPSTGNWTTVASMAATRGYHTSTLLLPDGRVLVAGSGSASPGYPGEQNSQFYSPPYLFAGPRPTIASAPASATYGSTVTVNTPDAASIKAVNLVDLGTSTHQMDFSQHFVPLSFTAGSGSLSVTMPASGNYAPPGNYMLFIVNSSGVPSVAAIVNVSSGTHPAVDSTARHIVQPHAAGRRGGRGIAFVQRSSSFADQVRSLPLALRAVPARGDRLVVQAVTWGRGARAASVTDAAGDRFTELVSKRSSDGAEMSAWTAPVGTGSGHGAITVTPTAMADVEAVAVEYAGLSSAQGLGAVDAITAAGGVTRKAGAAAAPPTAPTSDGPELALGLYADSGFGDRLQARPGYTARFTSPATTSMMEQLVEDRVVSRGHSIATSVGTGADTPWLMATVVFRSAHARTTRPAVRPVLDADRKAAGGALVPLTSRARPHRPAGTVTAFFGRGPDGRIVRYYCLVNPSGARSAKSVWSAVGQSSFEIKRNHPGLLG